MGEVRAGHVGREPVAIKPVVKDSGIPVLSNWELHTIAEKEGLTIWEKLGLQEMADQKPLPFDVRQVRAPNNPFMKRK